ncbi:hypothetical protein COCNU_scaffold013594G000010 [Cocos nucifera]|nr:hypothetical protein [Cocos nucifera]
MPSKFCSIMDLDDLCMLRAQFGISCEFDLELSDPTSGMCNLLLGQLTLYEESLWVGLRLSLPTFVVELFLLFEMRLEEIEAVKKLGLKKRKALESKVTVNFAKDKIKQMEAKFAVSQVKHIHRLLKSVLMAYDIGFTKCRSLANQLFPMIDVDLLEMAPPDDLELPKVIISMVDGTMRGLLK